MRIALQDTPGMSAEYGRLLADAVLRDKRLHQPKNLGRMHDPGVAEPDEPVRTLILTFNGGAMP
jgi:hypothetical protein